jgi:Bacterial DNA-binding protein
MARDDQDRTSNRARYSHPDQQKNRWSIPRRAEQPCLQSDQKKRRICLAGFWQACEAEKESAHRVNPKTQQRIKIRAKTVVKFRVAKAAKDAILGVKK